MQTETIVVSATPETTETVTVTTAAGDTKQVLSLLPQYAQTPKRGAKRKDRAEALALYQYALTQGGTVALTPEALSALHTLGLKAHRVTNAAYKLRKYYGIAVTSARTGRKVTSYTVSL